LSDLSAFQIPPVQSRRRGPIYQPEDHIIAQNQISTFISLEFWLERVGGLSVCNVTGVSDMAPHSEDFAVFV
jgi:hypothetical protein